MTIQGDLCVPEIAGAPDLDAHLARLHVALKQSSYRSRTRGTLEYVLGCYVGMPTLHTSLCI